MNNTSTSIRYVRPKDLAHHLSVSISTIWRYAKRPDFPMPVKLSEKVTAFNLDEINEWCERVNRSAMDALKSKRTLI
ncbi:AlpA family phage regulatory protein [Klebsiella pneumoniae]|uniref:helix-turn-helix transcriptional regulator n=1 Tax=Klebsiella pneumoniae TaxID=573 RepID=UPI0003EBB3E3|nr:AlpA family phage regulatory protein [Klebsiella pneumoniae]HDE1087159.1 AlpA family phage regulatory protein [Klebsiella quasipneumoniae]EKX1463456.1 AlpA family phage regulatory protein [Klebsiella pneumoniae]ELF1738364.1 AlpA family phage regulatory protein [Klebsiella pneumoniae]EMF2173154.1 AlpA family phage regulatory protein [Klebsiella pneumoniae]EWD00146.1 hypothetical protein X657_4745 [Klebsiella pneumoniae NB60]